MPTPVRVLDQAGSTDQVPWHNRYWIYSEGQIRQSEQAPRRGSFPGENHSHQGGKTMIKKLLSSLIPSVGRHRSSWRNRQGIQQWQSEAKTLTGAEYLIDCRSAAAGKQLVALCGD